MSTNTFIRDSLNWIWEILTMVAMISIRIPQLRSAALSNRFIMTWFIPKNTSIGIDDSEEQHRFYLACFLDHSVASTVFSFICCTSNRSSKLSLPKISIRSFPIVVSLLLLLADSESLILYCCGTIPSRVCLPQPFPLTVTDLTLVPVVLQSQCKTRIWAASPCDFEDHFYHQVLV